MIEECDEAIYGVHGVGVCVLATVWRVRALTECCDACRLS
jgi:hypothetical protein